MLPTAIRKLSCNRLVRKIAGHLHVSHLARRIYCQLLSHSGALQIAFLGVNAGFETHDSKQLAFVDYIVTTEKDFIELTLGDLHAGDTFLDVGCHYGIFSILASKLVGPTGRVIAVEPHPGALQILKENVAINRCVNVKVLDVAFSDTTGMLSLAFNENGAGPQNPSDPMSTIRAVKSVAGDEALQNEPIPAAVKIDVEGHELAVLIGLRQTLSSNACRRLCLEIHPTLLPSGINKDSIMKFIENCGFHILNENVRPPAVHVVAAK